MLYHAGTAGVSVPGAAGGPPATVAGGSLIVSVTVIVASGLMPLLATSVTA